MRLAFLVLASTHINALKFTIEVLKSKDVKFFIHVDSKFDLNCFLNLVTDDSVCIIEERKNIFWGGFSMVLAELALLNAAVAEGFERMVLISDDSFPLKPIAKMSEVFGSIDQWIGAPGAPDSRATERYSQFCYFDSIATNPRGTILEFGKFRPEEIDALRDLAAIMQKGKKPIARVFHGKQWWALTKDAAEYLLDVHKKDDHLRESFRFSPVPDEHYIQTIVGNASNEWKYRREFMWTDFTKNPKPYVFAGATELDQAFESEYLFVRKVSEETQLLSDLKARVLGSQ